MMEYAYLFLVVTILQGQDARDMRIEEIQATDITSCEEMRIEQTAILEAKAGVEDDLVWHVGECLTESPFLHRHNYR
jgi:hypothetical protein